MSEVSENVQTALSMDNSCQNGLGRGGFVELLQHARHHHALVDDGPARERGEVDLLRLGLFRVFVDDVRLGGAAHLVGSCNFMEFETRIIEVHAQIRN